MRAQRETKARHIPGNGPPEQPVVCQNLACGLDLLICARRLR
jgi:hypothetical protein